MTCECCGAWFPGSSCHQLHCADKDEIESLHTQLADALKRAEGAEEARNAANSAALRLNADLARVTEEKAHLEAACSHGHDALCKAMDLNQIAGERFEAALTAAQERIQALEGMVGMLWDALKTLEDERGSVEGGLYLNPNFVYEVTSKALSLTESQAAEVVRGMERVVEAVRRIDFPDGWSKVRDALAALDAVRGKG